MEQYFAKQLSNCCKLNFSNNVIKTQKPLLSPKNSPLKVVRTINKSEKKSLKRVHSDQALTMSKKTNLNVEFQTKKETKPQKQEKVFDDYGNQTIQNFQIQAARSRPIKKVFSAQNLITPTIINSQNKIISPNSNKKIDVNQQTNYCFSQNIIPMKTVQNVQKMQVSIVKNEKNESLAQKVYYIGQNPKPVHFQQAPNILHAIYYPQNEYQINNLNKKQIQTQQVKKISSKPSNEVKTIKHSKTFQTQQKSKIKHINLEQSEYFNKIYGEVDLQEQIKKDLMKSMDFNKTQTQTDSNSNGISVLIRSPTSSDQSTIIPLESRMTKKGDWHDSFNFDRKYQTQKILKVQKPQNQLSARIRIDRRQKFKSIVSVNSQHQSSEAVDSIIIQQHPQHLISSKPLKSLL